jgi:magnesium-transporting ATPase (P-type)
MTGEAMPVKKTQDHPFMLAGCNAIDGSGRMIVTAVGVNTEWGRTLDKVLSGHCPSLSKILV